MNELNGSGVESKGVLMSTHETLPLAVCNVVQSTQCAFYIFHFTTMDKIYLARTIAGDSKRSVAVIVH